jgi:hypothetical protein
LAGEPTQAGDPLPLLPPAPPLPFHQPLENLRRYFNQFEAPLPQVMEVLRKSDDLERANEDEYGWRDILMEELRISRAEYRLLTDRTLTLQHLYGYPTTIAENDILGGKVFEIEVNFITELDQGEISPGLIQLFADNSKPLSDQRQAAVRKLGEHWGIVDNFTFDLRKEGQRLAFISLVLLMPRNSLVE